VARNLRARRWDLISAASANHGRQSGFDEFDVAFDCGSSRDDQRVAVPKNMEFQDQFLEAVQLRLSETLVIVVLDGDLVQVLQVCT
jgi:hypothetical protein